jgi:hypothetical protein
MEARTLLDYGALTCFINKELMWQYKLALMEKNIPVSIDVIDGQNLSLRPLSQDPRMWNLH